MANLSAEEVAKVQAIVEKHGKEWLIAAMIHGSIGYHSVGSAETLINGVLKGRHWGCERTDACFKGDPIAEIEHDASYFEYLEENSSETPKRVLVLVEQLRKLSDVQQTTFGLMYPTLGL